MVQVVEHLQVLLEQVVLVAEEMDDVVQELRVILQVKLVTHLPLVLHKEAQVVMVNPLQEIEVAEVVELLLLEEMLQLVLIQEEQEEQEQQLQ